VADHSTSNDHGDHHGHPELPDESKLWDDQARGAYANDVARMWFVITMACVATYVTAVIVWIFL